MGPDRPTTETAGETAARRPSLTEALIPLVVMALLLAVGYAWLGYRIEVVLIGAAVTAGVVARRPGWSWKEMEEGIAAGTIPMLVSWGLELISPRFFLVTACVICSIVSISTGTSWGTVSRVGVVLTGVAGGLGIPLGAAAGAIVSGAYFGDRG